jgi:hypothetical protein
MFKINTTNKITGFIAAALLFSSVLTSCKKSDSNSQNSGNAKTSMGTTDAAIDDASVSGVFVTIADIKLDGQSIKGFNETTINLAAFKNGSVRNIGNFSLQGKSYSNITFVLDYSKDSSGVAPGAYVLTTDNVKHALTSSSNTITISKSFILKDTAQNAIVADFDLRKMLVHPTTGDTASYSFVTSAELQNSVRFVDANQSANISGTFTNTIYTSDTVVAYIYKAGTYTSSEMQEQGASHVRFANAVTSSVVGAAGAYKLSFLDSGNYEIHFASYNDVNHNGKLVLQGLFTSTATGADVLSLVLGAKANMNVDVTATANVSID